MIKFFRHIRQQLISENKTGRYLKYAIGEIVLVVIGILMALQINNWNTDRIAKKQENTILLELQAEYQGKMEELNQKVNLRNFMMDNSYKVLTYINEADYELNLDSLNTYLGGIFLTPTFDASNSVTEELINSGKLYIVSNKKLRNKITGWKAQIDKLKEEEDVVVKLIDNLYASKFFHYYPQNLIKSPFTDSNSKVALNFVKNVRVNDKKPLTSYKKIDLNTFYNDTEIENLLGTVYSLAYIGNMQSLDVRIYIDETLELITKELARRDP